MTLFITSNVGFTNIVKPLKIEERSMKIIMTRQSKIRYRNLNIVRSEIIHPTASTLDMNNLNNAYIESLKDNNCTDIKTNYRPCLKQLIKDNISIAEFIKPIQKNGPEKICTKSKKDCIADSALECKTDKYGQIFETVMFIRKEVNANKSWKFEGTFNDYQEPDMLHSLLNWIIKGFKRCLAFQNRELQLDTAVKNITQLIAKI